MSSDPTLGMVEALIRGLEGVGDNGGYIPGMCNDLLLVASHFGPNFFRLILDVRKFGTIFPL